MTNIIVHGLVSNKLITQGYHAGAEAPVLGGDSAHYYYRRKKKSDVELFSYLHELLHKIGEQT